jgi:hypothetical protein
VRTGWLPPCVDWFAKFVYCQVVKCAIANKYPLKSYILWGNGMTIYGTKCSDIAEFIMIKMLIELKNLRVLG